jgi:hypothetical protein
MVGSRNGMSDKPKLTGEMIVSDYDQSEVAVIIDELHKQLSDMRTLLNRSLKYIQHIDEVENSSCFYGCICGAEDLVSEIKAL